MPKKVPKYVEHKMAHFWVDVGGVIIDRVNDKSDTSFFGDRYLETTAVPGAFEALAILAKRFEIYLVSKCGPRTARRTLEWLAHHRFFERTGIPPENVRFCRERIDKASICKELGITHFVDDLPEVLGYLKTVPHRYLFNSKEAMPGVVMVKSWEELMRQV
jgi:5'(3')-deoxyribonucleotidase